MLSGSNAQDLLKGKQPTYHTMPNDTTGPAPDGPLDLGMIVSDTKFFRPITLDRSRWIPAPEDQVFTNVKEANVFIAYDSVGKKASFLTDLFHRLVRGIVGGGVEKTNELSYNFDKLETRYFIPDGDYIKKVVKSQRVAAREGKRVLLDHRAENCHRGNSGVGGAGIQAAGGPVDVHLDGQVAVSHGSGWESSSGKSSAFVVAVQVQKIYEKRSLLTGKKDWESKPELQGARLMGSGNKRDDLRHFGHEELKLEDVHGFDMMEEEDQSGEKKIWLSRVDCT
ncbi:hypothetical protein HJFPF1_02321 [Paramyrothecium foliicola]|nr:hypothetical protein HJFPF1_02321 [Paramyrothecium foliicola]